MNNLARFVASLTDMEKRTGAHAGPEKVHVRAGKLRMIYGDGSLKHIYSGGTELINRICSAVRDRDWITVEPTIGREKIDIQADSFRIEYDCSYRRGDVNFLAHYSIEGRSDSSVTFMLSGVAAGRFEKNRIGFCVLHPAAGCAGEKCLITHGNNESEMLEFPGLISPHQPFKDIRSMQWSAGPVLCNIDFSGDIFETEDQRNWTDASFKTYSTPLELPFPVRIEEGTRIDQTLVFKASGNILSPEADNEVTEITLDPGSSCGFPLTGIGRSTCPWPLSSGEYHILREVRFDHYRVDLYLFDSGWRKIADRASEESVRLDYALELALFFDDNSLEQVAGFIDWLSAGTRAVSIILIFHKTLLSTPAILQETVVPLLREAFPGVSIACGTNANFAQLNRGRPGDGDYDHVCYSVHPQEHAYDNETIAENLKGQAFTVESAAHIAGKKGLWISPVNIRRRFNANREAFEQPAGSEAFPSQADSRLMSLFGAGWTAGSIKYLAESGAAGITFFETTGERGIIQGDHDSRWPEEFRTVRGMIFPVYHLFRYLLGDKTFKIIKSVSTAPLKTECLALSDGCAMRIVLMSYSDSVEKVRLPHLTGEIKIKQLDTMNFDQFSTDPHWMDKNWGNFIINGGDLLIEPYSLTFIQVSINQDN